MLGPKRYALAREILRSAQDDGKTHVALASTMIHESAVVRRIEQLRPQYGDTVVAWEAMRGVSNEVARRMCRILFDIAVVQAEKLRWVSPLTAL